MKSDYQYPLDLDWSVEEMVAVTNLYAAVEKAYEEGIVIEELLTVYQKFKGIVRSISEEKRLDREFEKVSGYSVYRTIKAAKEKSSGKLKMEG
jgi:uncharacterized protein YktA (UPF0223 family)